MNDPVLTAHGLSRWVWMRGQSAIDDAGESSLVIDVDETGPLLESDGRHAVAPDLSDEVTAACLVRAVRRAWNWEDAHAAPRYADHTLESRRWVVVVRNERTGEGHRFEDVTELGALVAALEAAP